MKLRECFLKIIQKKIYKKLFIDKAKEFQPDIIFFILQKDQIEIETLKELRKNGFFIVNWFEFFEGYLNKIKIVYNYIKTRGLKSTLIKIKERL